jgi:hypothetical protein
VAQTENYIKQNLLKKMKTLSFFFFSFLVFSIFFFFFGFYIILRIFLKFYEEYFCHWGDIDIVL